jgi:diguanylate cyclase (GGDEF)-like protein
LKNPASLRLSINVRKNALLDALVSPRMNKETEGRIPLADLLVFHQLTRSLTSSFELDSVLRAILDQMERIVQAELWTLLMLDETTQELYYAIAGGGNQSKLRDLRVRPGEGVAGWVMEHGEALIIPEAHGDPRVIEVGPAQPHKLRSLIALPLRGRKGTHGVIEIFNPRAEQMNDYAIAFLNILSDHAAIAIENARDVTRIQQLTITDDTTGLFNVRHLYEALARELAICHSEQKPVSIAFLDLDRFKNVNDTHGHLVGSELLAKVGKRLQQLCRTQDECFRYGGDEFVLLMPGTDAPTSVAAVTHLHQALLSTDFHMNNGLLLAVSASIGLATAPADGDTLHAVIGTADKRMYAVKNSGRGQIRGA